jgi:ATP-dependent Lon protease
MRSRTAGDCRVHRAVVSRHRFPWYDREVTFRRIPLFPLPLVLLPRAPQPLHIFEPRYRRMVADCLAGDREFGIICRTADMPEREIPAGTAGCIAHIESAHELPDGRSNVLVVGMERFTLEGFVDDPAPYHVGSVRLFDDGAEILDDLHRVAEDLRQIFTRVGHAARAIQDDATPLPELPLDPAMLSFAIAQHVDIELAEKQELLASRSAAERLRRLGEILSPIVGAVEHRALVHERSKRNGQGPGAS